MRRHSTRLSREHDDDPGDDQGQHTAARDYPELGSVLDDRPDPGGVITVIGVRRTADAYGTEHDPRNQEYNGGEGDDGMYWAEPGQQAWKEQNLGPQEEAPPPLYDPGMSPVMARLAQIEEARQFVGAHPLERARLTRRATDVNGAHIDDHGDAPAHGTVPRATDPDGYDARSTEGDGDPKWDDALPGVSKDKANGATVGMYPEGMSAGGGPSLPVGAFTAVADWEERPDLVANIHGHMVDRAGLIRHMREGHGMPAGHPLERESDSSLRLVHTVGHSRGHQHADYVPDEGGYGYDPQHEYDRTEAPSEDEPDYGTAATYTAHPGAIDPVFGARTAMLGAEDAAALRRHVEGDHAFPLQGDYGDAALAAIHSGLHMSGLAPHVHEDDYETDPGWEGQGRDAGGYHEFTGLRRTARVPWTGKERGSLHRWQENPEGATWGDFVPSSEFPLLGPGEHVSHEDQGEGIGAEASARGPEEGEDDEGPGTGLRSVFGPDIRDTGPAMTSPEGYNLAQPERGGSAVADPAGAVLDSVPAKRPRHPAYWEQKDPARFRRMMNALNVHVRIDGKELAQHGHDDAADSLDHDEDSPQDKPQDNGPDKTGLGTASPQLDDPDSLDSPADVPQDDPQGPPQDGSQDAGDPEEWPQAGASVNERSRAYTQGSGDGKVTRGAPPAPFSPGDGDSGGGGDQDDADPDDEGGSDEGTPFSKGGALAMLTASAGSPAFRFEFTAAWSDVVAKARRIRSEGHVRIVHASHGMVIGEVRGDHDTYETGIQRPVGKRTAIAHWACGCPWASFHQTRKVASRFSGRPCSHVMALQFEAQARGMFGRAFESDSGVPDWSPPSVVVKSWPPYEGDPHAGKWREEWRAPAERRATLERSDGAPRQRAMSPEWSAGAPAERAVTALLRAGEDPGEVGALAVLAGMRATADQANAPWGGDNVSKTPPQKPYGATSPPNPDQDPGSYGPLAGPDPANWGGIDESSAYQMPMSSTASGHQVLVPGAPHPVPGDLHWPSVNGWQAEDQGTFGYTDRAAAAGPSTAMDPRDPNGIRMEESRKDCPCCGGTGEHSTGRECYGCDASGSSDGYSGSVPCDGTKPYGTDNEGHQVELDPLDGWQHLDGSVSHEDGSTVTDHRVNRTATGTPYPFRDTVPQPDGALAELRDHPEPALPETTAEDPQDEGEGLREQAGIDGTMGDAQDAPHRFTVSAPPYDYCVLCGGSRGVGAHVAAADGTIGGGDAGTGEGQGAPLDTAALGEFGAAQRMWLHHLAGTPMGDLGRETSPQAQQPSPVGQNPGMGSGDEYLTPDDQSIQTIGNQQWSGGGADSDEVTVPAGQPQGGIGDIVAAFQRSAAAKGYSGEGAPKGDGDIAVAARRYLSKTADVLPKAEADELIREGAGSRARNLDLLRLEGTHYEDADGDLAARGVSLDDYDDDVMFA